MRHLCDRLNMWGAPTDISFECENTRILIRAKSTLVGLFFVEGKQPYLHLLRDQTITGGIEYYVSRVLSASWDGMSLQRAETRLKS